MTTLVVMEIPYLIAEAGVNHEGDLETALEMVHAVSRAGWNAIKFQTYTADTLASKDFSSAYWDTNEEPETSQYRLFGKFRSLSADDYQRIREECEKCGIDFLTTYFALDDMLSFGASLKFVKIASADLTNVPLLRTAASVNTNLLLSVGAATDEEISFAVKTLKLSNGNVGVTLLHCILNYPTSVTDANLFRIPHLQKVFPDQRIGYSDHTKYEIGSPNASVLAAALGASVIEKHFSLDVTKRGNDHYHSANESGLASLREQIETNCLLFGNDSTDIIEIQQLAREQARRRIFTARQLPLGHIIAPEDIIPLRGSLGLSAREWDRVIGAETNKELATGEPVLDSDLRDS